MTSSRLPGKQMRLINDRPMMYHIVARLKKVKTFDKIVLATATKDENQGLAEYVRKFGVDTYFDDNEDDVTGRIARTAQHFNATHIVTISGDCPLIHPDFIERGVVQLQRSAADYLYIDKSKYQCLHEGIGFYSTTTWLKLDQLSTTRHHKYPLMMTIAVAASTAFLTPIGTTTNLMVLGPGEYRFGDYAKVGGPLVAIFLVICMVLIPIFWPF